MKKLFIFILITFLISIITKAQIINNTNSVYFIQNTISGGLSSSIVACFNKNKHNNIGKIFINSFWKGCIGGLINYCGKDLLRISSINNTYAYVWPSKILNSLGTSIIYNGAKNEKLFNSFNFPLWVLNCNYNKTDGFNAKIDLITLSGTGYYVFQKDFKFNLLNSLLTNTIFFDNNSTSNNISGTAIGNCIFREIVKINQFTSTPRHIYLSGTTYINDPIIGSKVILYDKPIAIHEITHVEEYNQYSVFNLLYGFNYNIEKYFFINANFSLIYEFAEIKGYNNNYFEHEADYFGNSYIPISNF